MLKGKTFDILKKLYPKIDTTTGQIGQLWECIQYSEVKGDLCADIDYYSSNF